MSTDYQKLLLDPRWQKKKNDILNRDNYTCQKCKSTTKTLHVHHLFYMAGKSPWDYDNNLLVTLCCDCHELTHNLPKITMNEGCIPVEMFLNKYPEATTKAFLEVGNHEGFWTVKINYRSNLSDILKGLYLLKSFIGFMDFDIHETNNDSVNIFDFIGYDKSLNCYPQEPPADYVKSDTDFVNDDELPF